VRSRNGSLILGILSSNLATLDPKAEANQEIEHHL